MIGVRPAFPFIQGFNPFLPGRQGGDSQFMQTGGCFDVADLVFGEVHFLRDKHGNFRDPVHMPAMFGLAQFNDTDEKGFGGFKTADQYRGRI